MPVYAGELLRCRVLVTSLYTAYYLGYFVARILYFIPLNDLIPRSTSY